MQELKKMELSSRVLTDPKEIVKHLHKGMSIPILQEFHKYIIGDIKNYEAKAIVLEEDIDEKRFGERTDKITGITLVYGDGSDTLFFGFFGVVDHNPEKVEYLVDKLIEYAKDNNYSSIRGPINVPTCIFGWGFMVEGSNQNLFVCCPVNPPVYQNILLEKGFSVRFEEDRYDCFVIKMDPYKLKYDYSDYEFIAPDREGINKYLDDFIRLHVDYMPPSARITPKIENNIANLVEFIYSYGYDNGMMWCIKHKSSGDIVAAGYIIPNPFIKDRRERVNSASFHDWVVHPDHRRRGLAMLLYGGGSIIVYKNGLRTGSWPVGADNIENSAAARKMGGKKDRTHLILECKI